MFIHLSKSIYKQKWILIIVFLALILRLTIVGFALQYRENTDILRYKDWARIAYLYGFADTYKSRHLTFGTLPNNQSPGSLYILSAAYNLQLQVAKLYIKLNHVKVGGNSWINGPLVTIFLRIPALFADLIIGLLIYIIVKKIRSKKQAVISCSLFLFNPVVLYNSSFWGQIDSVNNLFFLLAILLLFGKKYTWSCICFAISIYIKNSLVFFVPVFLLILYFQAGLKTIFYGVLSGIVVLLVLTIPISISPLWLISYYTRNSLGEMTHITNFAFNFWWVIFRPFISAGKPFDLFNFSEVRLVNSPFDNVVFFGLSFAVWSVIIFILFCLPFIWKIMLSKKHLLSPLQMVLIFSSIAYLAFLFLPRMHERYLFPTFPLLAIIVALQRKYLLVFISAIFFNLINLYIVWHPMMVWFFPYSTFNSSLFQWYMGFGLVITGFFFYFQSLRALYSHEK